MKISCTKTPILGLFGYGRNTDDGTLCRLASPTPGPIGSSTVSTVSVKQIKTVLDADGHGWLMVRHDLTTRGDRAGGTYPPLPQHLKVEVYKTNGGREHFTIMEGKLKGKTASVTLKTSGSSYLSSMHPAYRSGAKVKFNRKTKLLWYGSKASIPAFTQEYNQLGAPLSPIPLGIWALELPYEIYDLGASYYPYSKYASTWFHIVTSASDTYQDRYLHPGTLSHGCATVGMNRLSPGYAANSVNLKQSLTNWTDLYNFLIASRKNDKSVGTIEVVE